MLSPRSYQSVVSIGSQCLTGVMLQNAGLKLFSGPFDWIFSNMRMVCDCIEDDFAAFLDPREHISIPPAERAVPGTQFAHHALYRARYGLHALFNHSDPTEPATYAYLERCVARFRAVLASDQPQLLLAISKRSQGGRYAFDRLSKLLDDAPSVEICAMIVREPGATRQLEPWAENGRHRLFELTVTSPMEGIHFADHADNHYLADLLAQMVRLEPPETFRDPAA